MMDKREFAAYILLHLEEALDSSVYGPDTLVSIAEVHKAGGRKMTGLTVRKPGENIIPCIYLDEYHREYLEGRPLAEILEAIAAQDAGLRGNVDVPELREEDLSFESVCDAIYIQACDTERSREYLKGVPHMETGDISAIYRIRIAETDDIVQSVEISNPMLEMWGVSLDELHETAIANHMEYRQTVMYSMEELIGYRIPEMEEPADLLEGTHPIPSPQISVGKPMYVLTNREQTHGAACIFDKETMARVAAKLGGNFFLLPSSVHEILAVPDDGQIDYRKLSETVYDINRTIVEPREFLSDKVQYYDRQQKKILGKQEYLELQKEQILQTGEEGPEAGHAAPRM